MTARDLGRDLQTSSPVSVLSAGSAVESLALERWDEVVNAAAISDVYYRPGYVKAYEAVGQGGALALRVRVGSDEFLFPMLLRPLSDLSFASGFDGYDAVTPYGYGGMLWLSRDLVSPRTNLLGQVFKAMREWCQAMGIVSVLLRLHPVLQQERLFAGEIPGIELVPVGPTIALDLSLWNEDKQLLNSFSKGRRTDLNFAGRYLKVAWASEEPDRAKCFLEIFQSLYERRMRALNASAFYYFPPDYYQALSSHLGGDCDVAVASMEGEPVGAAMFLTGPHLAHYHLSGTSDLGRRYKAATLLLGEACRWARLRGCGWLHLGGGKSGIDPLFQFKQSFGGSQFECFLVRFIADPERYQELTRLRLAAPQLPSPRPDFFPAFRA